MNKRSPGVKPLAAPRDPVPVSSKLKFLFLHLLTALLLDVVARLRSVITGEAWRAQETRAFGSPQARTLFQLDAFEAVPYPDPAYSGHVSTILCAFRPHRHISYERVGHPGGDGNLMYVDWYHAADAATARGVFVIIPGLASWSGTNYIEHFVWYAHAHNFHCGVFNSRGMGNTPIETPRLMSAKWTDDLRAVVRDGPLSRSAIAQRCGTQLPIIGAGFSLGGVILSNYVGEECQAGRTSAFDAVMVVNSPLDCNDSSIRMERPFESVLYQPSMIGGLTAYARRHAKVLKDLPGLEGRVQAAFAKGHYDAILSPMKTVRDFDKVITAPTLGFATPEDYYQHISPIAWLPHITVPVLCVSAVDDPVCGPPPMEALEKIMARNTNVALLTIPHGGHLGYIRSLRNEWVGSECFMETLLYSIADNITVKQ